VIRVTVIQTAALSAPENFGIKTHGPGKDKWKILPPAQIKNLNELPSMQSRNHNHNSPKPANQSSQSPTLAGMDSIGQPKSSACGKPDLRAISQNHFSSETRRGFTSEAAIFCLLMLTVIPALLNGARAVITLMR
jgi:hypothetical protein